MVFGTLGSATKNCAESKIAAQNQVFHRGQPAFFMRSPGTKVALAPVGLSKRVKHTWDVCVFSVKLAAKSRTVTSLKNKQQINTWACLKMRHTNKWLVPFCFPWLLFNTKNKVPLKKDAPRHETDVRLALPRPASGLRRDV